MNYMGFLWWEKKAHIGAAIYILQKRYVDMYVFSIQHYILLMNMLSVLFVSP